MFLNWGITEIDMTRNLDMTSLRSFVAVAETGGVTRAAGLLNLTQSAVSMQLKRLEEALGLALLDRAGRGIALTPSGEQLLGYAHRMLDINDEVYRRLTSQSYEGEVKLGAPHDLVYRVIPQILKQFHATHPRMRVILSSTMTRTLKEQFARGELDMILTTEAAPVEGAETLTTLPLLWVGAPDGQAWKERPLRFASEPLCIFRPYVFRALNAAGIPWEMGVESDATRAVEAGVEADLAVYTQLGGLTPPTMAPIAHGGTLPELPSFAVNFYRAETARGPAHDALADIIRTGYRTLNPGSTQRPSRSLAATG